MPWNFARNPVQNIAAHVERLEVRAGARKLHRVEPVPDELTKTAAQEAEQRAGGVIIPNLHAGSVSLAHKTGR
jgi:hypothetical protein